MQAYEKVALARALGRPTAQAYIQTIFGDFFELHGDRFFYDDTAIVAGIALLNEQPVTVISIEKGVDTRQKVMRNFGSVHPEGYRKALRLMHQAEKFNRPVLCFIDTSGAYCGIGAEERGQGSAIAQNLMEMMQLHVPIISMIIGEGGSGGALALAVANQVWMLENAIYSVISPEGAASILYKDAAMAKQASEDLKLTAQDLLELGIIDRIIEEHEDAAETFTQLKALLVAQLQAYAAWQPEEFYLHRYDKFRSIGRVTL